jgi:hypothetical protein
MSVWGKPSKYPPAHVAPLCAALAYSHSIVGAFIIVVFVEIGCPQPTG